MPTSRFIFKGKTHTLSEGTVSWQSPSNIALIKYWGKHGEQLPKNASLSFTLKNCHTQTRLSFQHKNTGSFDLEVFLDGKREKSFEPKILTFFERIEVFMPFIKEYKFRLETSNSFPHSSGIASSASGMGALALCLMSIENSLSGMESNSSELKQKASFLARLGSGSACRSIDGGLGVWGEHPEIAGSNDLFGMQYPNEVHPVFKNYQDTILLVDKGEKKVSSTVGHQLMKGHPFAKNRFRQAGENLSKLIPVLKEGNLPEFIKIVENEALSLHAMMLSSLPYFILMKPNTLEIINRIWDFRQQTGANVCFTLDAGANVHVLYPEAEKGEVLKFIETDLKQFCKDGEFINDEVGPGAFEI